MHYTITLTALEYFTLQYLLNCCDEHIVKDEHETNHYIDDGCVLVGFDTQEMNAFRRILTKLKGAS